MTIINFLKRLFKYNNPKTVALINISDIIKVPTRYDLANDLDKLKQVDIYKEDYLKIIRSKRMLVSNDFSCPNIGRDVQINIELLLNIYLNDSEEIKSISQNNTKKLNQILKIKLCQHDLERLETEIITRLIALNEIYTERKFFISSNKREDIINAINNLLSTLLMITNQKRAIALEVEAYFNNINDPNNENVGFLKVRKKDLNHLLDITEKIIPQKIEKILYLDLDNTWLVAYLEREIEIYALTNQEKLCELAQNLHLLDIEEKTKENREVLLAKINQIEFYYNIFREFGRNIVTEDELYNLYRVKFDILTVDICNRRELPIDTFKKEEVEIYKQIIMKKVENILKGVAPELIGLYGNELSKIVVLITKILKDGERKFSAEKILTNPLLLSLVLALNKENGLEEFFKTFKLNKDKCNIKFFELVFHLEDELPLDTICRIYACDDNPPNFLLYDLYKFMKERKPESNDDTYMLPEGLFRIYSYEAFDNEPSIIEKIRANAKDKVFIMPDSLDKIYGPLLKDVEIKGLRLNEGLRFIGDSFFEGCKLKELIFPSSLEAFPLYANLSNIETIGFNNFEDSYILNNEEELHHFIAATFHKEHIGRKYRSLPEHIRKKQKAYNEGRYSTFSDPDLFKHSGYDLEFILKPLFKNLILYSKENKPPITISADDLQIKYMCDEDTLSWLRNNNYSKMDIYDKRIVESKLEEIIQKKSEWTLPLKRVKK